MSAGRLLRRFFYAGFLVLDLAASWLTFGAPWQTLSARLGKAKGLLHWACRALDAVVWRIFAEADHCHWSLIAYEAREAAALEVAWREAGLASWGGRRVPAWRRKLRAFFRPDALKLRDEKGFDVDPAPARPLPAHVDFAEIGKPSGGSDEQKRFS